MAVVNKVIITSGTGSARMSIEVSYPDDPARTRALIHPTHPRNPEIHPARRRLISGARES